MRPIHYPQQGVLSQLAQRQRQQLGNPGMPGDPATSGTGWWGQPGLTRPDYGPRPVPALPPASPYPNTSFGGPVGVQPQNNPFQSPNPQGQLPNWWRQQGPFQPNPMGPRQLDPAFGSRTPASSTMYSGVLGQPARPGMQGGALAGILARQRGGYGT